MCFPTPNQTSEEFGNVESKNRSFNETACQCDNFDNLLTWVTELSFRTLFLRKSKSKHYVLWLPPRDFTEHQQQYYSLAAAFCYLGLCRLINKVWRTLHYILQHLPTLLFLKAKIIADTRSKNKSAEYVCWNKETFSLLWVVVFRIICGVIMDITRYGCWASTSIHVVVVSIKLVSHFYWRKGFL